jgi:hypothetical protein
MHIPALFVPSIAPTDGTFVHIGMAFDGTFLHICIGAQSNLREGTLEKTTTIMAKFQKKITMI